MRYLIWIVLPLALACGGEGPVDRPGESSAGGEGGSPAISKRTEGGYTTVSMAGSEVTIKIAHGDRFSALAYYERIKVELGLDQLAGSNMVDLLEFLGYGAIHPKDLEQLDSVILMSPEELAVGARNPKELEEYFESQPLQTGEILSMRFFAPKIMDLTGIPSGSDQYLFGWRKLIRLLAREGSPAHDNGIESGSILFNFVAALGAEPFTGNVSKNNQAMLVRKAWDVARDPTYWLVYDQVTDAGGGLLINFLTANFELPATLAPEGKYYVPNSCAQCHGVKRALSEGEPIANGKLNYLDTDHWLDRVQDGDDFSALRSVDHPVLFDGGIDLQSPQHELAFEIIRRYNTEVQAQNAMVDAGNAATRPSLQTRAAAKWLQLHPGGGAGDGHVAPIGRELEPLAAGDLMWDAGDPLDQELVPLLNQYCFRCHSSIRYSVFDKKQVKRKALNMAGRIEIANMPQDRTVDEAGSEAEKTDLRRIAELLRQLSNNG